MESSHHEFVAPPSSWGIASVDMETGQSATLMVYDAHGHPFSLHVQTPATFPEPTEPGDVVGDTEPTLPITEITEAAVDDLLTNHFLQVLPFLVRQSE